MAITKVPPAQVSNPYKFSAYMSASQALTITTWTKMNMDTENYDTNSNYDTTAKGYTAPVNGYYQFSATMLLQSQAGTTFLGALSKTGTNELYRLWEVPNTTGNCTQSGSIEIYLTAGETIYLMGYTGTAKTILGTMQYSRFSGRLISAD